MICFLANCPAKIIFTATMRSTRRELEFVVEPQVRQSVGGKRHQNQPRHWDLSEKRRWHESADSPRFQRVPLMFSYGINAPPATAVALQPSPPPRVEIRIVLGY